MNVSENPNYWKSVMGSSITFGAYILVNIKGALHTESSHMDFMCMFLKLKSMSNLKFLYMTTALGKKSVYLGYTFQVLLYCRNRFLDP